VLCRYPKNGCSFICPGLATALRPEHRKVVRPILGTGWIKVELPWRAPLNVSPLGNWMKRINTAITVCILAYFVVVALWYAVSAPLDHDEHQFMASAFLVARYGRQPYQDFAYFHMPNLVYLYALFFLLPYPFTLARLFSGFCGFGLCLAIFMSARSLFAEEDTLKRLILPIASTALLVHSPLFAYASSHVWNHTPSTLCAVVAFFWLCRAIRGNNALWYFFLSGLGLGMAIGIRLSFAPVILPFLLAVVFRTGTVRDKGLNTMAFALGGLLANLPAVYFLLTSPDGFLFGNLGYAQLNTIYRQEMTFLGQMTLAEKIKYIKNSVFAQPGELVILVVTLYSGGLLGIEMMGKKARPSLESMLLLLILPFVYLGCIAPTPAWYQYYFALVPFMILLSLYTLSSLVGSAFCDAATLLIAVSALISIIYGSPSKNASVMRGLMSPESWTPNRVQRAAENISVYVNARDGEGEILTLSPLYAILGGTPIYKEFVTGPFAWRVSYLLSEEDAVKRGLPVPTKIESFLEERHPRAILTGEEEKQLEAPLINAAQQLGYQRTVTASGVVAWLPPK